jgi:hypothetical protein
MPLVAVAVFVQALVDWVEHLVLETTETQGWAIQEATPVLVG